MAPKKSAVLVSLIATTDNLGIKYVHSALLQAGHDSHVVFYTSEDESYFDQVAHFIKERSPDLVGISLMSRFFPAAVNLTAKIRQVCNGAMPIVWGGIHPTIDPENSKQHADYVCVGEGERVLEQFLSQLEGGKPATDVMGITSADAPEHTISPTIQDLDSLPFPQVLPPNAWVTDGGTLKPLNATLLRKHTGHNAMYLPVMSSRGCPFACTYCCNNLLHRIYGKKIRLRSPENVIAEVEKDLSESGMEFRYLNVNDDCFTAHSTAWLETFVKLYKKIRLPLVFRAIPQFITKEKIAILKEAPCGFALIGLQSGSERTLAEVYERHHSSEAFDRCAKLLDEADIPAVYDLIVDNPYETITDVERSVEVIAGLPKSSYVSLASLTFYKYTALYDRAKREGLPVDEHLTKRQDAWQKSSREVRAMRIAALVSRRAALSVLHSGDGVGGAALSAAASVSLKILEPLRYLKMIYLSCGKDNRTFVRTMLPHARDYAKRYFSLSKLNKHKH
jgi:anaerobic magnesium-protoporphyrin IX monomethyl ester cyclase